MKIIFPLALALTAVAFANNGLRTTGQRLAVADATTHQIHILDLETAKVLGSFSTPGKISYIQASPNGQYAIAVHRDDHRITLVHSGLSLQDHGDHKDLVEKAPYVLATMNVGKQPTHYFGHGDHIAFFNDGDGTIAILNQNALGLSLDFKQIKTAQPDHGAPVVMNDVVLSGYLRLNRVDVFNLSDGKLIQTIEGCPALHGEAMVGNTVWFGCTDGVLQLTRGSDGKFVAVKIKNPAGIKENVRVGTVVAHDKAQVAYGNFGQGVAIIRPGKTELEPVALPANPVRFSFDQAGTSLIVLTADGKLHELEPNTGKVRKSLDAISAMKTPAAGETALRPSMAISKDAAYLGDPEKAEIVEVDLATMKVERRLKVSGPPSSVAVLHLPGGVKH